MKPKHYPVNKYFDLLNSCFPQAMVPKFLILSLSSVLFHFDWLLILLTFGMNIVCEKLVKYVISTLTNFQLIYS